MPASPFPIKTEKQEKKRTTMIRKLYSIQKNVYRLFAVIACSVGITSCDNILDNGYGDCTPPAPIEPDVVLDEYRVKFKYDYNMKYADAFAHEVLSVNLYAFDEGGKLVWQAKEAGAALAQEGYTMKVELPAGNYEFLTWAGLLNEESFDVPDMPVGLSTLEELTATMNRYDAAGIDSVGYLQPLWHGKEKVTLPKSPEARATIVNTHIVEIPLVKNTNTFRIILQQLSEEPIDVNDFEFRIDDKNGFMAHDNSILEDTPLVYYPYHYATGSTEAGAEGDENLNLAVAELSTGRLMADAETKLTITNKETGEVVFSIPLIKYLSVYKTVANYDMPLQEFLDREDEYVLHFFLDERGEWLKTQVIINDWIVRYNDITAEF